ncbi:hypothetical protein BJX70DRAFT_391448 [Aspergillus crustosus]
MSSTSSDHTHSTITTTTKPTNAVDIECQAKSVPVTHDKTKSLGAGSALALDAFGTTLTTPSLSLMEWRGVTTTNVSWELSIGNGFAYTVFSAFGLFDAGYGALLTPSFGIAAAYTDGTSGAEYNTTTPYFAWADGRIEIAGRLQKSGGVFCFLAGLVGWYVVFHFLLQGSLLDLPLGDTGRAFGKWGLRRDYTGEKGE